MRKFVTLGVAAMGLVGFLGLGASSASAAQGPGQATMCAAIDNAVTAQLTPTAAAQNADNAATANFSAAVTAFDSALSTYGNTLTTWVLDSDAHSTNVNVDAVAFQNAATNLTTAITDWSSTSAALVKANGSLAVINLQ